MTFLYNCRHSGDEYRITKFDEHFEVEGNSSYLCTTSECECPAGVRPTCRHREMLPKFINRNHVGDEYFFDFDRGGWVQGPSEFEPDPQPVRSPFPLPEGVQVIPMGDPIALHNAIADAVGEPEARIEPAQTPEEALEAMAACDYWNGRKSLGKPEDITATEIDERMAKVELKGPDFTEQLDAIASLLPAPAKWRRF